MTKIKKHIIALPIDKELHAMIANAASERRISITGWCRQQLIDALPKEKSASPKKEHIQTLEERIMGVLKETVTEWVIPFDCVMALGENIDDCAKALLIMLSEKIVILHPEDSRFETAKTAMRYKLNPGKK